MRNRSRLLAALAAVACVLPGAVAHAQVSRLDQIRLEGYVGPPPEGRRERADLTLGTGKKDVQFQVTGATVLSGKITPSTVFSRVRPYRPNFILRGPQELIDQVANAAPRARLRIVGAWRTGSPDFLLGSVETKPSDRQASP